MPIPTLEIITGEWNGKIQRFRKGYVIVNVLPDDPSENTIDKTFDSVLSNVRGAQIEVRYGTWAYVKVPDRSNIPLLAEKLSNLSAVEYAEPDFAMEPSLWPHDADAPLGYDQWAIDDDHLRMRLVWDEETGSDEVLIGVIDSGIALVDAANGALAAGDSIRNDLLAHSELQFVDATGTINGGDLTKFIAGNHVIEAGTPSAFPQDKTGHGTRVAGIIGATIDNTVITAGNQFAAMGGKSVVGINHVSRIYVCKITDDATATATHGLVTKAIEEIAQYAKDVVSSSGKLRKVVVNLSYNYDPSTEGTYIGTLEAWFNKIVSDDIVLVVSTGNTIGFMQPPASYAVECPNIVAVGSVDFNGTRAADSGKGGGTTPSGNTSEVSVVAPGEGIWAPSMLGGAPLFEQKSGTSYAAAFVTGIVSLLRSRNPCATAPQIVSCLKATSLPRTPATDYGSGFTDPLSALDGILSLTLTTPSIAFVNVAAGTEPGSNIIVDSQSQGDICFEVTAQGPFEVYPDGGTTPLSDGVTYTLGHGAGTGTFKMNVIYPSSAPDTAEGVVKISAGHKPSGDPYFEAEVTISANRIIASVTPTSTAIALSLDKSGSMELASGSPGLTRLQVLDWASRVFIDLIEMGSQIVVNSFDETAHDVAPLTTINTSSEAAAQLSREAVKGGLSNLSAGGWTSIATGADDARDKLNSSTVTANPTARAVVVVTDGKENTSPLIPSIIGSFEYPVFAIGLGAPEALDTVTLTTLTSSTGGLLFLTGPLDETAKELVAKFYVQIHATITGDAVSSDPANWLRLSEPQGYEYPFSFTRRDGRIDFIVTMLGPRMIDVTVKDPLGNDVAITEVAHGEHVSRYRLGTGVDTSAPLWRRGNWKARIKPNRDAITAYVSSLPPNHPERDVLETHGLYHILAVHMRSDVRMRCSLSQSGSSPGSKLYLQAVLTENLLPLTQQVSVRAVVTEPTGVQTVIPLPNVSRGSYAGTFETRVVGVHMCKIMAVGASRHGDKFTREFLLTGAVWGGA